MITNMGVYILKDLQQKVKLYSENYNVLSGIGVVRSYTQWGVASVRDFEQGIYGVGNVGSINESPIHTEGYGILIVKDFNNLKFFLIADCQMGGGIGCGMATL